MNTEIILSPPAQLMPAPLFAPDRTAYRATVCPEDFRDGREWVGSASRIGGVEVISR